MNTESQKELSKAEFWEKRYTEQDLQGEAGSEEYEWFKTYAKLKPFLSKHMTSQHAHPRVLHLGCGTSTLTTDLYHAGFRNQVSIDFSKNAIAIMKQRNQDLELEWEVMDVRHMTFQDACIDVAIDKGTLDAMLHGSLWDPEEDVKANTRSYVDEVARVLKPGGQWLYVTFRQPHFLKPLLARPETWSITVETLEDTPGSFEYFGFVMTKVRAQS